MPPRILVVEDEENVAFVVTTALRHAGFDTVEAPDGREGLRLAQTHTDLDLVILDVMMPELDGFEVYARLRASGSRVPVVFLTARDEVHDRIKGLSLGADAYLTKPFGVEQLVSRVRAIVRGAGHLSATAVLTCDDLVLDDDIRRVTRGEEEVVLSPTEYRMLRFLIRHAGQVVSPLQIRDHVWEYGFHGEASVVETFISSLSEKIDTKPPRLIHTVSGLGYRLDCC
jgi:two-component system, OmpR family, response regulator